jgi:hypothetical protein
MFTRRVIIVAVGEKGVVYGSGDRSMPQEFFDLLDESRAASWTLTRGGAVAYFADSRRTKHLLKSFFDRAEKLRESIPSLGIGVAHYLAIGQYNLFGRLKRDFDVNYSVEQNALDNVQGAQTYRDIFEELQ